VVVGEEPVRFVVGAATFEIGQCAGKKARHSSIRSNLKWQHSLGKCSTPTDPDFRFHPQANDIVHGVPFPRALLARFPIQVARVQEHRRHVRIYRVEFHDMS
jgi:hypothetical protein